MTTIYASKISLFTSVKNYIAFGEQTQGASNFSAR